MDLRKIIFFLFAKHFVAGETIDKALTAAYQLQKKGLGVIFNVLGEHAKNILDVEKFTKENLALLYRINEDEFLLKSRVSLKLSQLGLDINESLCRNKLNIILDAAKAYGIAVEFDREEPAFAEKVHEIFIEARRIHQDARLTMQLNLQRSIPELYFNEKEKVPLRVCKGAYRGDYINESRIREYFLRVISIIAETSDFYREAGNLAIATHDFELIDGIVAIVKKEKIAKYSFEFQFLYGLGMKRANELLALGFPVWIYLPYGNEWLPYGKRRWKSLAKIIMRNNARFLIKSG